jgi:hypothetical protein
MAVNIFEQYGIKEVANVYFEALEADPKAGVYANDIVLYLDSLKVSTIETTAENTAAQGGWGNPKLVQWDYGKEINITLEDALMSLESLRFMLGGAIKKPSNDNSVIVRHTEEVVCLANGIVPLPKDHLTGETLKPKAFVGHPIRLINLTTGARTQIEVREGTDKQMTGNTAITFKNPKLIEGGTQVTAKDNRIRIFWDEEIKGAQGETETAVEVTISPDTFPGTYRVVGDTLIRNSNGKDEAFQFVINKAKVQSNVTITLQAEGDPSTFEMTLNVLRSTNEDGKPEMMKLVRYGFATETTSGAEDDITTVAAGTLENVSGSSD